MVQFNGSRTGRPQEMGGHGHRVRRRLRRRAVPLSRRRATSTRCSGPSGSRSSCWCEDPWRILLTTDHPNGAPFTSYPHLIRLLMDSAFREEMMLKRPARGAASPARCRRSTASTRSTTIAIITRAGPARLLGLNDRGHLGPAPAPTSPSIPTTPTARRMFATPDLGVQGRRGGRARRQRGEGGAGRNPCRAARVRPLHREAARRVLRPLSHDRDGATSASATRRSCDGGRGQIVVQPTRARVT